MCLLPKNPRHERAVSFEEPSGHRWLAHAQNVVKGLSTRFIKTSHQHTEILKFEGLIGIQCNCKSNANASESKGAPFDLGTTRCSIVSANTMSSGGLKNLILDIVAVHSTFKSRGEIPTDGSKIGAKFKVLQHDGQSFLVIDNGVRLKLERHLKKIASDSQPEIVPVEFLCRLQEFCMDALKVVLSMSSAESVETITDAFASARIILLTMCGQPNESKICSDELISMVLSTLQKAMGFRQSLSEKIVGQKSKHLEGQIEKTLQILSQFVAKVNVSQYISSIQTLAMHVILPDVCRKTTAKLSKVAATDLIFRIFFHYPEERDFLVTDVLNSVPSNDVAVDRSVDILLDGTRITPVSALLLRFVQLSASPTDQKSDHVTYYEPPLNGVAQSLALIDAPVNAPVEDVVEDAQEDAGEEPVEDPVTHAMAKAMETAIRYAQQIVQNCQKQSSPFFVRTICQDLLTVLGLPKWPAAELLLRALLLAMLNAAEEESASTSVRKTALEILSSMGVAISRLYNDVQKSGIAISGGPQPLNDCLTANDVCCWDGLYHLASNSIECAGPDDLHAKSAKDYLIMQWARSVFGEKDELGEETDMVDRSLKGFLARAHSTASQSSKITESLGCQTSSTRGCRAYSVILMAQGFCRQLPRIYAIVREGLGDEAACVRITCLKGLIGILKNNSMLLARARNIESFLWRLIADPSELVREAALITMQDASVNIHSPFRQWVFSMLCHDFGSSVRLQKRALKMLRDIYRSSEDRQSRISVASRLLPKVKDSDQGVAVTAQKLLEGLWLGDAVEPATPCCDDTKDTLAIIKASVQQCSDRELAFVHFVRQATSESLHGSLTLQNCQCLLAAAFECLIDDNDQIAMLRWLSFFAEANASLFVPEQLGILEPMVCEVRGKPFKNAIALLRLIVQRTQRVEISLLLRVQKSLLKSTFKVRESDINEFAACLWTVSVRAEQTVQITDLLCTLTRELGSFARLDLSEPIQCKLLAQTRKLVLLIGSLSRYCDSQCQEKIAKGLSDSCKHWDADSTMQTLLSFTGECQPTLLRLDAVMSVSFFCRSWPDQFRSSEVHAVFYANLRPDKSELHTITIRALIALYDDEGLPPTEPNSLPASNVHDRDRIGALLVSRYLDSLRDIATTSQGTSALEAAKLLAVISTEGLVRPQELYHTWVSLGISTNLEIRCIATKQQQELYRRHARSLQPYCIEAVRMAFDYQLRVLEDDQGVTHEHRHFTPKLYTLFKTTNTSDTASRRTFFEHYCDELVLELESWDSGAIQSINFSYPKFLAENLAFFAFGHLEDIVHTISILRAILTTRGPIYAQIIDSEYFRTRRIDGNMAARGEPSRFEQITCVSILLSIVGELLNYFVTFVQLRQAEERQKKASRRLVETIMEGLFNFHEAHGREFIEAVARRLDSRAHRDTMGQQCHDFATNLIGNHLAAKAKTRKRKRAVGKGG